jgi:hypothetical protein
VYRWVKYRCLSDIKHHAVKRMSMEDGQRGPGVHKALTATMVTRLVQKKDVEWFVLIKELCHVMSCHGYMYFHMMHMMCVHAFKHGPHSATCHYLYLLEDGIAVVPCVYC